MERSKVVEGKETCFIVATCRKFLTSFKTVCHRSLFINVTAIKRPSREAGFLGDAVFFFFYEYRPLAKLSKHESGHRKQRVLYVTQDISFPCGITYFGSKTEHKLSLEQTPN